MDSHEYANVKQLDYKDDLKEASIASWDRIPLEAQRTLSASMSRCMLKLVTKEGGEKGL